MLSLIVPCAVIRVAVKSPASRACTTGLHIADFLVRGRITWDENEGGRLPMLVIDGKEISWEQFGRMVMGFEGWQFKFEIKDRSEEV